MGIEEKLPSGVLLTSVEKIAGWARARSVWPATFGLACCAIELMMTGGPRHDLARFGMEKTGSTPREADLMIVAGQTERARAHPAIFSTEVSMTPLGSFSSMPIASPIPGRRAARHRRTRRAR